MLLLMAPVLVPVLVHSYGGLEVEDCPRAAAELFADAGPPDSKRDAWMREAFQAEQWAEGRFTGGDAAIDCSFLVVRSYDAKRLYHRPYNSLAEGAAGGSRLEWISSGSGRIPIHLVQYESGDPARLTGYLLVYNSRPVAHPYSAQLAAFPLQLLSGARPMTLFLISATGPRPEWPAIGGQVRQWLAAQWQRYRTACSL
jgi:hypothetical protein